jgi:hypothetical protein
MQIERLAAGLDPTSALVIFHEGANWTPRREWRGIRRLEHAGHSDLAAKAKDMPNLLPQRPGDAGPHWGRATAWHASCAGARTRGATAGKCRRPARWWP